MHSDEVHMAHALRLARRGLFTTDPNPRVGCVLVKDDVVVGDGFHVRTGEPHAEVHALRSVGNDARGATAYVTLEPCCHQGRTPPCADALIEAGVARVVVATRDPNPQVAGRGIDALRAAGIAVDEGVLATQAEALNPGFFSRMRRGRPWVRLKSAISLDGRTAMAGGESKWITGEPARRDVQRWRARSSAVMTGGATVAADDPSLNVRASAADLGIDGEVRQPLRVVLDTDLKMAPDAQLLATGGNCLIFTARDEGHEYERLHAAGAELVTVDKSGRGVDLAQVAHKLAARECNEVQVEAGPTLGGALLEQGLVDELVIYMAPHLMGDSARGLVSLPGVSEMAARIELNIGDVRMVGADMRITATVKDRD